MAGSLDDRVVRVALLAAAEPLVLIADADVALRLAAYGVLRADAVDSLLRLSELARRMAECRCVNEGAEEAWAGFWS